MRLFPVTWQRWRHAIRYAIAENPMLHANLTALYSVKPIEVLHFVTRAFRTFFVRVTVTLTLTLTLTLHSMFCCRNFHHVTTVLFIWENWIFVIVKFLWIRPNLYGLRSAAVTSRRDDLVATMSHWKAACRRDIYVCVWMLVLAQWLLRRPQYCRENTVGNWWNRFTAILACDR